MSSPLLTSRTIAAIRQIARRAMSDTCTITIPGTPVNDGAGGATPGPTTTITTACRFIRRETAISERIIDAATAPAASWFLWLPIGTAMRVPSQVSGIEQSFRAIWPANPDQVDAFAAYILVALELI